MVLHSIYDINEKGHLTVSGLDSTELAKEYGTPLYLLDTDHVRKMCRTYKEAMEESFGSDSKPVYAGKALCYSGIYKIIKDEGLYADCVSSGELYIATKAGFDPEHIFFHGNNKTDEDLRYAAVLGIGHIVVDGDDELDALEAIASNLGTNVHIILRITPGIDPHTHKKIITGNVDSKFGTAIKTGQAKEIVKKTLSKKHIVLDGLHCHIGSQIFETEPFVDALVIMIKFMSELKKDLGYETSLLNLGGGFGVRYTEKDPVIDYTANIEKLGEELSRLCLLYDVRKPVIYMEPGRSIVAAAGATLYTCGTVKEIPGFRNYVSVDGGMTDDPRYTLYQSEYTIVNATKAGEEADFECTISGRCCESGDLLAENIKIRKPSRGDIIATLVTGAYNYSMASNYNMIPRAPLVEISRGKANLAVRRETFEDLISRDADPTKKG